MKKLVRRLFFTSIVIGFVLAALIVVVHFTIGESSLISLLAGKTTEYKTVIEHQQVEVDPFEMQRLEVNKARETRNQAQEALKQAQAALEVEILQLDAMVNEKASSTEALKEELRAEELSLL